MAKPGLALHTNHGQLPSYRVHVSPRGSPKKHETQTRDVHGLGLRGANAGGSRGLQESPAPGLAEPDHVQRDKGQEENDSFDATGAWPGGQKQESRRKTVYEYACATRGKFLWDPGSRFCSCDVVALLYVLRTCSACFACFFVSCFYCLFVAAGLSVHVCRVRAVFHRGKQGVPQEQHPAANLARRGWRHRKYFSPISCSCLLVVIFYFNVVLFFSFAIP